MTPGGLEAQQRRRRWRPPPRSLRLPCLPACSPCLPCLPAASPVDSILDKEAYTLEELLDEDELIQECKSLNARLTAYLKQKDTVQKLVGAAAPGGAARHATPHHRAACSA